MQVLPGGPVALAAPSLVVGLGPRCRQLLPCRLEAGARLVECLSNPAAVIARLAAGTFSFRAAARVAPLNAASMVSNRIPDLSLCRLCADNLDTLVTSHRSLPQLAHS